MVYSSCPSMSTDPYNSNPGYHVFVTESSTHDTASRRLFQVVGGYICISLGPGRQEASLHTFQVEEDVGLVVLEHLRDQFHVHVLDVDVLF